MQRPPNRGSDRDDLPEPGLHELARRLMNAARRVTTCESDAEELVSDGFARSFCPDRPGRVCSSLKSPSRSGSAEGSKRATRYSREVPDIVVRCARPREQRSEEDERLINSFVWRLTMTTKRHLWRTRSRTATREDALAEYQCAAAVLDTIEDELCRWSEDEEAVTRVLDDILTEISRKPEDRRKALKDRLRSELEDAEEHAKNKDIAAKYGMKLATLSSDWNRLLLSIIGRKSHVDS